MTIALGGGVALMALLFCVAAGANVYVNSSDDAKILKAIELGAKGGVNYKTGTVPTSIHSYIGLGVISNRCDYLYAPNAPVF